MFAISVRRSSTPERLSSSLFCHLTSSSFPTSFFGAIELLCDCVVFVVCKDHFMVREDRFVVREDHFMVREDHFTLSDDLDFHLLHRLLT